MWVGNSISSLTWVSVLCVASQTTCIMKFRSVCKMQQWDMTKFKNIYNRQLSTACGYFRYKQLAEPLVLTANKMTFKPNCYIWSGSKRFWEVFMLCDTTYMYRLFFAFEQLSSSLHLYRYWKIKMFKPQSKVIIGCIIQSIDRSDSSF